jgi:hypothetical protein
MIWMAEPRPGIPWATWLWLRVKANQRREARNSKEDLNI